MNLYRRYLQLRNDIQTDETENCIDLPSLEADNLTLPASLSSHSEEPISWICNNVYYISDIHLGHQIARIFPNGTTGATNVKVKSYIKKVAHELFSDEFVANIKDLNPPMVIFGGDISTLFEISKIFYAEFISYWNKLETQYSHSTKHRKRYIYVVLGNHELWDFANLDECYAAYKCLFESLDICFLNNSITWFGTYRLPRNDYGSPSCYYNQELVTKDDTAEYELQARYIHNTIIVGGIGFAGCNGEFNADMGIYRKVLSRTQEIEQTKKWNEVYSHALDVAKKTNSILIVLTHNPIADWIEDGQATSSCIYFNGHTHRNCLYHNEEANIHIFSNNQIGYKNSHIRFKQAYIYNRANPFASFSDGYHEINSSDYLKFYDYMQEHIAGNGCVEREIKNNDGHFYMIKHSGYYGFFLVSRKGIYVCAGGRIKKIRKEGDIAQFDTNFSNMVNTYLKALSPYRKAQEHVAEAVKSFGGDGRIHGTIIDIDFFDHIMLNPFDGTLTYYYSPIFGQIKPYSSLLELLSNNNEVLANKYRKQLSSGDLPSTSQIDAIGEMIQIDIKNSVYAISNRINQLQRLFSKKILRDWNDDLLIHNEQGSAPLLEQPPSRVTSNRLSTS